MSAAVAAAAAVANAARVSSNRTSHHRSNQGLGVNHRGMPFYPPSTQPTLLVPVLSRYQSLKRRDWNEFEQFLEKHRPKLRLSQCSGLHVLEFLEDRFGDTKFHTQNCPFLVNRPEPQSPCSCSCPLKEAWSSMDGLVGRLRVAFEENGGGQEMNPFNAPVVRLYLMEVKEAQAMAREIA